MQITVNTGAHANLVNCQLAGSLSYGQYSYGRLDRVRGKFNLTLYGGAFADISGNDLSQVNVTATGDAGQPLDLSYNWWGTTDPREIEAKIIHKFDSPSRPLVNFNPWLTGAPSPTAVQAWLAVDKVVVQAGASTDLPLVVYSGFGAVDFTLFFEHPANRIAGMDLADPAGNIGGSSVWSFSETTSALNIRATTDQPIQGVQRPAELRVVTLPAQSTAVIDLSLTGVAATNESGSFSATGPGDTVRLLIVGREPFLEALLLSTGQRSLRLYGNPGTNYMIETAANLSSETPWEPFITDILLTNLSQLISIPAAATPAVFYRAREK
jgi:hypothetical protein